MLQPWSPTTNRSVTTFGQNSFELASGEVITFTGFDGNDLCSSKASFTPVPDPQRPGFSITKVELARSADYGKTQTIEVGSGPGPHLPLNKTTTRPCANRITSFLSPGA